MKPYAAVLAIALAACSGNGAGKPAASGTATPPASTAPATATAQPTRKPPARPTATPLRTDLADGRHYAYAKSLDTTKRTVTIDVVQFLTGEAAEKAAQEDGEEAFDYYIRNTNARLRTLTFAPTMPIVVNTLTAAETGSSSKNTTITLAKWRSYFAKNQAQKRLYILTLKGGVVTRVDEQYLP